MDFKKCKLSQTRSLIFGSKILILLLISSACIYVRSKTIGPDIVARARLLRDLPLTRTLRAQSKVGQRQQGHVTNIDVSISVRSVGLEFREGIFSMNGWIALRFGK